MKNAAHQGDRICGHIDEETGIACQTLVAGYVLACAACQPELRTISDTIMTKRTVADDIAAQERLDASLALRTGQARIIGDPEVRHHT